MNDTLGALIQGIASPDRGLRLHCVERLVQLGGEAVPRLCESVRRGGLLEKCAATSALGRIGNREATATLLFALSSSAGRRSSLDHSTHALRWNLPATIPLMPHTALATVPALVSPLPCRSCAYSGHLLVTPGDIFLLPVAYAP